MFDLHSHILPNIDDGAKNMEMSLAMLKIAAENGTKNIVATPHIIEGEWLPTWDIILKKCDILQQGCQQAGLDLRIFPGGEVAIHFDIIALLKGPGTYCINSGRYLLVELPATHIPTYTEKFFFTLQTKGITPILAHPERHPEISKNPEILAEWIGMGVLSQMNGTSITGIMGERVMRTAELLLTNSMVHVIGSDAHSIRTRNTNLAVAAERIKSLVGPKGTEQLLVVNPRNILESQEVDIPEIKGINYPRAMSGVRKWLVNIMPSFSKN